MSATARTVWRSHSRTAFFAQLLLGLALVAAQLGWRDPEWSIRIAITGIGLVAAGGAAFAAWRGLGRWLIVAVDIWFIALGLTLGQTIRGEQSLASGQWDPGPEVIDQIVRFERWFDPAVRLPVIAVFVIAGIIGLVAAARFSSAGSTPRR